MAYILAIISIILIVNAKTESFTFSPLDKSGSSTYTLCTYTQVQYEKCLHTVDVSQRNSIDLPLKCKLRNNFKDCINAVWTYAADMIVLDDDHQKTARRAGLKAVLYERDSNRSLYIAVAPRDIDLVAIKSAPIIVNQSNHRAYHAAAFFNSLRGHDICRLFNHARDGDYIKIVNSIDYLPNNDEILLCPYGWYAPFTKYQECNFETGLQRTVFMRPVLSNVIEDVKRKVFDTILTRFHPPYNSKSGVEFNFFSSFNGIDDVIFKNDAISFDLKPTYRNNINEDVFSTLHCHTRENIHDPSVLE